MTEAGPTAMAMRAAAAELLAGLGEEQRLLASLSFADTGRRHFTYLPRPHAGVSLAELDISGRKSAHRLLATALSSSGYAQALAIMALEEVLDRKEGWRRGRHSSDFWIAIFGDPVRDDSWAWRWEGHHLSASLTIDGDRVHATPLFLGAHPAAVRWSGETVLRPLGPEEDLARELIDAMGRDARNLAIVASDPPSDIRTTTRPHVEGRIEPPGVSIAQLNPASKRLLNRLASLYIGRLADDLAAQEASQLAQEELTFAWEGPLRQGAGHYYRIQGCDLLIEYDNTANGANHAHTILRRPTYDFGGGSDGGD